MEFINIKAYMPVFSGEIVVEDDNTEEKVSLFVYCMSDLEESDIKVNKSRIEYQRLIKLKPFEHEELSNYEKVLAISQDGYEVYEVVTSSREVFLSREPVI